MTALHDKLNRIGPWRFLLFFVLLAGFSAVGLSFAEWSKALLGGFDAAAVVFVLTCLPLYRRDAKQLRIAARRNDANRLTLLALTFVLSLIIFATILFELGQKDALTGWEKALIAITLVTVWTFGNLTYTLHYAHLFYTSDDNGKDCAGLVFPGTKLPLLSDFTYFSFTLGVAVQTSDVDVTSQHIRKVVTFHCVAGFFFNLGVLALTINVLGGS